MRAFFTSIVLTFCLFPVYLLGQSIERVEPPNWWVGMQNEQLQILVYGENISKTTPRLSAYEGVTLDSIVRAESPNYLFLYLTISKQAQAGKLEFQFFAKEKRITSYSYQLKERASNSRERKGFSSEDAIYLLMPDRFANGNPANDSNPDMDEGVNRSAIHGRHGGDIQGIIEHIDYLKNLGITALWTTPVMEDNLPEASYHQYAISDYYKIDARFGTNQDYKRLSSTAKRHGIKLIMDVVTNHCSIAHWWLKDLPFKDWIHQFPKFTRSNYRINTWNDPYASQKDKRLNNKGWFDYTMPDLNQSSPHLLNYLTQVFIWWIEFADLGGLRIDTFPYNDITAMSQFNQRIMNEYPNFNIVGECWQRSPQEVSYWQENAENPDGYNSQLPSIMDFPLMDAMALAFNEKGGWETGMSRLYRLFGLDYAYPNTNNILVFLDNHDTERFSNTVGHSLSKMKLALSLICTVRGIPQIYSGTEIMMAGSKSVGDGDLRRDFPGGWNTDKKDAFKEAGRDSTQNAIFKHLQTLLKYRKKTPALQEGKTTHFVPENDVYVYFRYDQEKTIMICLNNNDTEMEISTERFSECMNNLVQGRDILSGELLSNLQHIKIPARSSLIIELQK